MILLAMCARSVQTENTSIQDQIIFRDTLGYITWIRIKTIRNSGKCFHRDQKVQVEGGGGEAVHHDLSLCWI